MKRLGGVVAAVVLIAALPASVLANGVPDIDGSTPIYTQTDVFSAGTWAVTVYSYVYDETSTTLPGTHAVDSGEMLFMYLLDHIIESSSTSVDHFTVGNPQLMPIHDVGYEDNVVPSGYIIGDFDEPYIYGYSTLAKEVTYTYFGDFGDPWVTLDPGEYSLVFYYADSDAYGPVPGSVVGGGAGDTASIPGPVPEPTTLCLLGLGALALLRKRRA